jgi:phosphoribosylformylglycinamidine cyclo-ligase
VRRVIASAGWELDRHVDEFGRTLGEELLVPTKVYASDCLALIRALNVDGAAPVHGFSHITGGGFAANLARVLPAGLAATVDRSAWTLPPVFQVVSSLGGVPQADLERTLNVGVGMVAIVSAEAADAAVSLLNARGVNSWVVGSVTSISDEILADPETVQGAKGVDGGAVRLTGSYAS